MHDAAAHALALRLLETRLLRFEQPGRSSAAFDELERLLTVSLRQASASAQRADAHAQREEQRHSE